MSLEQSFSNTFEDDTDSLAGGLSSIAAPTPVPAPVPASVASLPSYENAYSAFGGKEGTDSLLAQLRGMGLSEDTIASSLSPYYTTAPTNTVAAPVTPVVNNYADTQSVVEQPQVLGGLDQGFAQNLDTQAVAEQPQVLSGLAQTTPPNTTQMGDLSGSAFPNWQQEQDVRQQEVNKRILANDKTLSGNIMAGASWHSLNPTLADQLTQATGQQTFNTAVGGATTADTLQQLNDFTGAGGSFAPGSNLVLQQGGLDFVYGVDKEQTLNNLDQIISYMNQQGVNVVLAGSPYASSFADVESNNFNPELDQIYNTLANKYSNVTLVDSMGRILQDKSLLADPIHPNAKGWEMYNQSILDALNNRNRTTEQG
jgi:lysophospholipase L1-like esterase